MTNESVFHKLLHAQIGNEFAASQQYIAIAVYYDGIDMPRLASYFYAQAVEERNHAMMIVRHLLDRGIAVDLPGVAAPQTAFDDFRDPIELALTHEKTVTEQIVDLARTARDEGDYLGEQFLQWFLSEQVEEVATMTTLHTIAERAQGNMFDVENFVRREMSGSEATTTNAPRAAGGNL
ncbi:ferritin [Gordonia sp. CPCC 206044]|uniref:ferritin n=1 Tax=Gordonia sp. CPCC 206044 TaxID=3140793 RepID=UPI003AF40150